MTNFDNIFAARDYNSLIRMVIEFEINNQFGQLKILLLVEKRKPSTVDNESLIQVENLL